MSEASWGLDMAGLAGSLNSLSAAGGIGGLLATRDRGADLGSSTDDKSYAHFYDGNGNTAQLVQVGNDTTVAAYEYDAYGQLEASAGSYAAENRWRFSAKLFEADTELGYWGYRWYSPRLGRWVSRDPIGERGGANLAAFVGNEPLSMHDALGLARRSAIARGFGPGGLFYSCHCGWVDMGHVGDGSTWRDQISAIESGRGARTRNDKGYVVSYGNRSYLGLVRSGGEYIIWGTPSGTALRNAALAISRDSWLETEVKQSGFFFDPAATGFSEEDMPSNLVGFYRDILQLTAQSIFDVCGGLTISQSFRIWDESGGVSQNANLQFTGTHWVPAYKNSKSQTASNCCGKDSAWPSNFSTYSPAPESAWFKVPDNPDSDEARNLPGGW